MAWDGSDYVDGAAADAIASGSSIPPGFYDAGQQMLTLRFRRPVAPYHLCKVVTDRFTGLLFSQKKHPRAQLEADPQSEDFAQALIAESRLWPAMIQARTFGGAMGSVAIGFQFIDGTPYVEVHDPRFVHPEFYDRTTLRLRSLEKRYMYNIEQWDHESEKWIDIPIWYRRVIDEKYDTVFMPVPVGDGREPNWDELIEVRVEHDFGFCPAVWVQNLPVQGEIDGESDCHGIYDLTEEIDALNSQASVGTKANCDPTLVISSKDEFEGTIRKGSRHALKLTEGSASYMEMSGSGPAAAREQAQELRKMALEVSQCVLEHPDTGQKTATEVERVYSSMLAKADVLREQYGERGVKPLVNMMLLAAEKIMKPKTVEGKIVRGRIDLPPAIEKDPDGAVRKVSRTLAKGPHRATLQWPGYFEPSLQDATLAVQAATGAKAGGLVDDEHAIKMVAEHFGVEDVGQLAKTLRKLQAEQEARMFNVPSFNQEE
jgi:hypothetical protein